MRVVSSNEADRIAGEIYAPPIRFKRAKEFRCSYVYEHRNQFLEEAEHRQAGRQTGGRTSSRRYLHSSGPDKRAPMDLRKVIPPCGHVGKGRETETEREKESLVDDSMG